MECLGEGGSLSFPCVLDFLPGKFFPNVLVLFATGCFVSFIRIRYPQFFGFIVEIILLSAAISVGRSIWELNIGVVYLQAGVRGRWVQMTRQLAAPSSAPCYYSR
jgi:general stress protein CsbA